MAHVVGIEAVVSEFVEQDFVGREVVETVRVKGDESVDGEMQGGFAEGVLSESVAEVADGTDGEEALQGGASAEQFVEEGAQTCTMSSVLRRLRVKLRSGSLWQFPTTAPVSFSR